MGKQFEQGEQGQARFEASCRVMLIPRCPSCLAANPQALLKCRVCGTDAPVPTLQAETDTVLTLDKLDLRWYERLLLGVGQWLRKLAGSIDP